MSGIADGQQHFIAAHAVGNDQHGNVVNAILVDRVEDQIAEDSLTQKVIGNDVLELLLTEVTGEEFCSTMIDIEVDDVVVIDIVHLHAFVVV